MTRIIYYVLFRDILETTYRRSSGYPRCIALACREACFKLRSQSKAPIPQIQLVVDLLENKLYNQLYSVFVFVYKVM